MSLRAIIESYLTPVVAAYDTSANPGQSIPSATLTGLNFDHKLVDTMNAVTFPSSVWTFTCPPKLPGRYLICTNCVLELGVNISFRITMDVTVNGNQAIKGSDSSAATSNISNLFGSMVIGEVDMVPGDTVQVRFFQSSGGPARNLESAAPSGNRVCIRRMNYI